MIMETTYAEVLGLLRRFEETRDSRVLCYFAAENGAKPFGSDDVDMIISLLGKSGTEKKLTLILNTQGGSITGAYHVATIIRRFCRELEIFPCEKARSAGTLVCLSANQIVLGPKAQLSPLDPRLQSALPGATNMPAEISAEEIRMLPEMAADWFKISGQTGKQNILGSALQSIFPPTLAALYRADAYMRKVAIELLAYQLPAASVARRRRIIDWLISCYPDHSHTFSLESLVAAGLRVRARTAEEEGILSELHSKLLALTRRNPGGLGAAPRGLMANSSCMADYQVRPDGDGGQSLPDQSNLAKPLGAKARFGWEIVK